MTRAEKMAFLRQLYELACGYCGITEAEVGGVLTRDHYRPLGVQGRNSVDNMVYACATCNAAKGDYWSDVPERCLLHPQNDNLSAHWQLEQDGTLTAHTERGAVTLSLLQLNRPELIQRRRNGQETIAVPPLPHCGKLTRKRRR